MVGFFKQIGRAAKSVVHDISSATTGKHGLLGSKGTFGLITHGKFLRAAKAAGGAVGQVTSNHAIQAAFPMLAVPASVVAGAAAKGPKGALAAVQNFGKNPIIKAELAAVSVAFPPLAPATAAGIAAMEASSRVVDAIRSGDPKKMAAAAMQIGGTQLAAAAGNLDAARGLQLIKDVDKARKLVNGAAPEALAAVKAAAKGGNAKAKTLLTIIQHQAIREAHKETQSKDPHVRAAGRQRLIAAEKSAPGILVGTMAALKTPKGVRFGDFALLGTGRILHKGKPVRQFKPGHIPPAKRSTKAAFKRQPTAAHK